MRKKSLKDCSLYAILDKDASGLRPLIGLAAGFRKAGVDIIQLRDKQASKKELLREASLIKKKLRDSRTLFIINDHCDVAQLVGCDGVHLGQDDLPLRALRRLLGKDKIIGISCHSYAQALKAQQEGADYISIGPVFATPTKPEYRAVGLGLLKRCQASIRLPIFAIGGIDTTNARETVLAGAQGIAVCRALCQARDIDARVSQLRNLI